MQVDVGSVLLKKGYLGFWGFHLAQIRADMQAFDGYDLASISSAGETSLSVSSIFSCVDIKGVVYNYVLSLLA